jgi:urea transport system ATP-binding protein
LKSLARVRSVIVIEHDMEFVRQLECNVTVLCEGKVLTDGTMEKVQNDPAVIEQYLGRAREKTREKSKAVPHA